MPQAHFGVAFALMLERGNTLRMPCSLHRRMVLFPASRYQLATLPTASVTLRLATQGANLVSWPFASRTWVPSLAHPAPQPLASWHLALPPCRWVPSLSPCQNALCILRPVTLTHPAVAPTALLPRISLHSCLIAQAPPLKCTVAERKW